MFATAEKSTASPGHIHRQADENRVFFRKAGEEEAVGEQQSAFFSTPVQAKLSVSRPDDPQEKEADHVADQVMRMEAPVTGKEEQKEEKAASPGGNSVQTMPVQRKADFLPSSTLIQRSGRDPPGGVMHFEQNLSSSKGKGSPMPGSTLEFMQDRFDADFSGVRIHTGSYAESLSTTIHAQAFTHGNDIYFNSGKYSPETGEGKTLLAHELTHTIQQGAVRSDSPTGRISEKIQEKSMLSRVPAGPVPQMTQAVELAKSKEGKVNAAKEGPDGYREGWQDLLEFFKTTFGADKIISGAGGTATPGTVAEQDIKKKRTTEGMIVNPQDINGDRITGERDAMPSWCGIFVFWALNKSGIPMPKWQLGKSFIKPEAAYPGGYIPRAGDIAYKEGYSHYAIVESATGNTVRTVNGNTAGEDNLGGQVQTREHPLSEWSVFFNPLILKTGPLGSGNGAVEEKPKTLRELRRELFNVNRKVESEPDDEVKTADPADKDLQAKPEPGNWSIGKDGRIHANDNINTNISKNSTSDIEREEMKPDEEEREGEEKVSPSAEITVSQKEEKVQNGWFDSAISFVNSAIDYVAEGLEAGKRLLLGEARDFVMAIPGYKALRVVLGEDPITGEEIERNGHNFIEAAFDIILGGNLLHEKLTELGALDEAAQWIDNGISAVESLVQNVVTRVETFWNGLSLESLASPTQIFRDAGDIIYDTISDVIDFAVEAGTELLAIVKRWLLTQVVGFIKERTTAYPLLTVILGKDPVTEAEVARNGTNILNALLELGGEEGQKQRTQMVDTGTFDKVAAWIDRGILVFGNLYQTIRDNFGLIWSVVSIEALMNPVEKFTEIYNTFAQPVLDVLQFVADTAVIILQFIKEVLMKRLSEWAREQRGYYLLTVILGKDPFTDEKVKRTTENVIRGFMSLMEGGEAQFAQMKESGAIARATGQIDAAVDRLNMTPAYIVQLFIGLWKSFGINDLMEPLQAFARIFDTLARPILKLVAFVIEIVKIVVLVILEIMQFPFDVINNIIAKTVKSFHLIKSDPIGFLTNILRAIKEGFIKFFDNILTHLVNGLVGWLTMELKDAGVPELKDLSLKGIISWVLEILGISMEKIWEKLAKHPKVGPARVAKIRGMIGKLEGIWTFIKDVQERGMAAIWDKIQEKLGELWNTVLDAVKNWIMDKIVTQMTVKLLSMLDPTGIMAVVNSVIAIYKAIQSFIKYLRRMLEILNSFVEGVAEIASGNITKAASFLEKTLASGIPIVIGFLANQLSLNGLGKRIGEMIGKVREMVDKALEWLVNKAVDTGMAFLDKVVSLGKGAMAALTSWWRGEKKFTAADTKTHKVYFSGEGENATLMVQSDPTPYTNFLTDYESKLGTAANEEVAVGSQKKTRSAVIADARVIAGNIETEKKKAIATYAGADDKAKEQAKAAAVEDLLQKLAAVSIPLFGTTKPADNEITLPAGVNNHQFATVAEAVNIYKTPKVTGNGSGPTSAKHNIYDIIDNRQKGKASYYIRGHLINDNLGGPGMWTNMTALSRTGNHQHEGQVESKVKAAFDAGAVIRYKVETSGNQAVQSPTPADKPKFTKIPDIDSKFDLISKVIEEEKKVVTSLKCEAFTRKKEGQAWVDDKPIVQAEVVNPVETGFNTYELGDNVEAPVINLTTGENMDKLADSIDYQGNKIVFTSKIRSFIEHKIDSTESSFASYERLASYKIVISEDPPATTEFTGEEKAYITNDMKKNKNIKLS